MSRQARRTRLAPSPTGSLHLGNARTFLLTWALARNAGWSVLLRIEDLDLERVRVETIAETSAILAWLGLDWDGPATLQSADPTPYRDAMARLARRGVVFRCDRSRADVRRAASAPHRDEGGTEGEIRYPPSLRPSEDAYGFQEVAANHRLRVDPGPESVCDELHGDLTFDPGGEVGDFLLWTRMGVPSYQLAVTVDDGRQEITDVVRGDDLLPSAARQQMLHRLLAQPAPRWWHLPLVFDETGARLAKRRDARSLASLRDAGVRRERILGLVATWCGFRGRREELGLDDFRPLVDPDTLRRMVVRERSAGGCRVTGDDLRWLLS